MARAGYTTPNEAELLRRVGWQFDPDLVIVQFFVNDALLSSPNYGREGGAWLTPRLRLVPVRFARGPYAQVPYLPSLRGGSTPCDTVTNPTSGSTAYMRTGLWGGSSLRPRSTKWAIRRGLEASPLFS